MYATNGSWLSWSISQHFASCRAANKTSALYIYRNKLHINVIFLFHLTKDIYFIVIKLCNVCCVRISIHFIFLDVVLQIITTQCSIPKQVLTIININIYLTKYKYISYIHTYKFLHHTINDATWMKFSNYSQVY